MPACVIPVGPDWQDPIGVPNSTPEILDPKPEWGADVSIQATGEQTFQFYVRDINVGRPIFVAFQIEDRRAFDFMFANEGPTPQPHVVAPTISCAHLGKVIMRHSIKAAVADEPFANDVNNPLAVANDGRFAIISWTLNVTCPMPMPQ